MILSVNTVSNPSMKLGADEISPFNFHNFNGRTSVFSFFTITAS